MKSGRLRSALIAALVFAPALTFAQASPAAANEQGWIDTTDRSEVLEAYLAEFQRTEPESGWNGDIASCTPGSTTQEYRDNVIQRVNWYRRMAGLDTVTERMAYTSATQQASLMMSAEGLLSHTPDANWACYTEAGATAASKSNLALGVNGIGAIDAYVRDPGSNNFSVGHRRTMFYPQLREVGTGDVETASGNWAGNTLHVFDDNLWADRPEVREDRGFVAWPPSGYIPPATMWGRWSFSLAGADFGSATVSVSDSSASFKRR